MPKLKRSKEKKAARFFLGFFIAVFFSIFIQIFLFNFSFGYSPALQGVLLLFWLPFLALAARFALLHKEWLFRHKYRLLAVVMLCIFAIQVWVGFSTRQAVDHDYGKIYNGAAIFVTQGDVEDFQVYKNYYHHFTNNAGGFVVLQLFFSALYRVGITDFYDISIFTGHLLFALCILFTFLYLDRAFGTGAALLSLLLFTAYLPVYFQSSIIYTDTMTIWMPPLMLYWHERAKTAGRWWKSALLYGCTGLVLGLGLQLKPTVLFTAIAIFIEFLLAGGWKKILAALLSATLACTLFTTAFQAYTYHIVLDEERVQMESMPVTFWLMMGLMGDGSYNHTDDWVITSSVAGLDARTKLNLLHIHDRLEAMGPDGYLHLLHRKTCRTFGSGNGEVNYLLVRQPHNPSHWLYRFISADGQFFRYFDNLCHTVYLSFYLLSMGGAFLAIKKKQADYLTHSAPFFALMGFYAFMLLWESNHRLLVNQWPLYIIAAAAGAATLLRHISLHKLPFAKAKSLPCASTAEEPAE